jgi:hypothetical protein
MSTNRPRVSNQRLSPDYDYNKADFLPQLGIYVGTVQNIDTNSRSGRLEVYISQFGGADPEESQTLRVVSYASPFMGTTTGNSNPLDPKGADPATQNTFYWTQQSYGFYMTPPDIGSKVLCCFPPNSLEGFWFACINPDYSRSMIPAIGSAKWENIDANSIDSAGLRPYVRPGTPYPVAEANRYIKAVYNGQSANEIPKPIHVPQTYRLILQGLDSDPLRGAISSSAQRDPVSGVFGFSTPGRPFGTQDPANKPDIEDRIKTGQFNSSEFKVTTRMGGHSLVLDDGDLLGNSNLVRLKTAAGHQILMNDKEGFMYIANSSGTAWVELNKEGDILIYGKRDLSIRNQGNVMVTSDRNINFSAAGNFNVSAGGAIALEGKAVTANADGVLNLYGKQTQLKGQSGMGIISGSSMSIKSSGAMSVNGSTIALNGGGGGGETSPPPKLKKFSSPDAIQVNGLWQAEPGLLSTINSKVPTHEPFIRGSVSAEIQRQTAVANSYSTAVDGQPISPPVDITSKGISQASTAGLTRAAPTSAFITQPDPVNGIGVLGKDQLRAYMAQTGYSESNGKYDATNQYGYQGKYQLGSLALQDLGYVKAGTPQTTEALSNPNNWTGKNGVSSNADFLASPEVQESAMYDYTRRNYSTLQSKGIITPDTTQEQAAGYLSSAHLVGAGGTSKWVTSGQTVADANGTTAAQYYNRGVYSQTQISTIVASNASKTTG